MQSGPWEIFDVYELLLISDFYNNPDGKRLWICGVGGFWIASD